MAQFIICTIGTAGDVNPFLAIGAELSKGGHSVVFATSSEFEDDIRAAGLVFESILSKEEYRATMHHPDLWDRKKSAQVIAKAIFSCIPLTVECVRKHMRDRQTVLVTSRFMYGALVAREIFQLPTMTVNLSPILMRSVNSPPVLPSIAIPLWSGKFKTQLTFLLSDYFIRKYLAPVINTHRRSLGLKEIRDVRHYENGVERIVCAWPEWLYSKQHDWPGNAETVGFIFEDGRFAKYGPSSDSDEKPIVFTMGSANVHAIAFFEVAARAAVRIGRPAILVIPASSPVPSQLPGSVCCVSSASFGKLLPRAAAIVHHGGIGTCARALQAGIPQLVLPCANDQFDNAHRLAKLGVSLTIDSKQLSEQLLTQTLEEALASRQMQEACRKYSSLLEGNDGASRCAQMAIDLANN